MRFGVLGGDRRQSKLAAWLSARGADAVIWGAEAAPKGLQAPVDRVLAADSVILPMPVTKDGENLYAPGGEVPLPLTELWPKLRPEQLIFAGSVSSSQAETAAGYGLKLLDYMAREELLVRNAVATAAAMGHSWKEIWF